MPLAELMCPNCGGELRYIEEYGRHYCHDCNQYAPEGFGGGEGLTCPTCGGVLSYIREYDRYYCHRDGKYVGDAPAPEPTPAPPPPAASDIDEFDEFLPGLEPPPPKAEPRKEGPPSQPPSPVSAAPPPPSVVSLVPPGIARKAPATGTPSTTPPPTPPAAEPRPARRLWPLQSRAPPAAPAAHPPPLSRAELWKAKRPVLEQLCTAYGLNPKGSREALRDRLLTKLDEIEREGARVGGVAPSAEGTPQKPTAGTPVEPATERIPAPIAPIAEPAAAQATPKFRPPPAEPARAVAELQSKVVVREATIPAPRPEGAATRAAEGAKVGRGETEAGTSLVAVRPQVVAIRDARPEPKATEAPPTTPPPGARGVPLAAPREGVKGKTPPAIPQRVVPAVAISGGAAPVIAVHPEPQQEAPRAPEARPSPEPAIVAPEAPKPVHPCPTCGGNLRYVKRHDRYYCPNCRAYAPTHAKAEAIAPSVAAPTPPAAPVPACPTCGRALTFIPDFRRHYCYACKRYAPFARVAPEIRAEAARAAPALCLTCGGELRYIGQYGRHYCDTCGKYAPRRARRPCPTCGADLSWIARYRRYYCTSCLRYAPATFSPPVSAAARLAIMAAATERPAAVAEAAPTARPEPPRRTVGTILPLGIALVGLLLYALSAIFILFSAQLGLPPSVTPTPSVAYIAQYCGVMLMMAGTIWGLWILISRK